MQAIIRNKQDLIEWLKAIGVDTEGIGIPEVKPFSSKWAFCNQPDWMYEDVLILVGRGNHKEEMGGYLKAVIDAEEQGDHIRLNFVKATLGPRHYTRYSDLPRIIITKQAFEAISGMNELISLIATEIDYKIEMDTQ